MYQPPPGIFLGHRCGISPAQIRCDEKFPHSLDDIHSTQIPTILDFDAAGASLRIEAPSNKGTIKLWCDSSPVEHDDAELCPRSLRLIGPGVSLLASQGRLICGDGEPVRSFVTRVVDSTPGFLVLEVIPALERVCVSTALVFTTTINPAAGFLLLIQDLYVPSGFEMDIVRSATIAQMVRDWQAAASNTPTNTTTTTTAANPAPHSATTASSSPAPPPLGARFSLAARALAEASQALVQWAHNATLPPSIRLMRLPTTTRVSTPLANPISIRSPARPPHHTTTTATAATTTTTAAATTAAGHPARTSGASHQDPGLFSSTWLLDERSANYDRTTGRAASPKNFVGEGADDTRWVVCRDCWARLTDVEFTFRFATAQGLPSFGVMTLSGQLAMSLSLEASVQAQTNLLPSRQSLVRLPLLGAPPHFTVFDETVELAPYLDFGLGLAIKTSLSITAARPAFSQRAEASLQWLLYMRSGVEIGTTSRTIVKTWSEVRVRADATGAYQNIGAKCPPSHLLAGMHASLEAESMYHLVHITEQDQHTEPVQLASWELLAPTCLPPDSAAHQNTAPTTAAREAPTPTSHHHPAAEEPALLAAGRRYGLGGYTLAKDQPFCGPTIETRFICGYSTVLPVMVFERTVAREEAGNVTVALGWALRPDIKNGILAASINGARKGRLRQVITLRGNAQA
ncbi:hypothetical protein PAPYR_1694 [Paratrimastix pyriformis]|uniref:Uncharacterized protein n=1 Tax=Paratrimastix pyriformis TaxID=342808 RepID=A0ABQ8UUF5_9EUKA|nr:hypothetical protein PAPYR_1694 [Paratrimastix pyriformis]